MMRARGRAGVADRLGHPLRGAWRRRRSVRWAGPWVAMLVASEVLDRFLGIVLTKGLEGRQLLATLRSVVVPVAFLSFTLSVGGAIAALAYLMSSRCRAFAARWRRRLLRRTRRTSWISAATSATCLLVPAFLYLPTWNSAGVIVGCVIDACLVFRFVHRALSRPPRPWTSAIRTEATDGARFTVLLAADVWGWILASAALSCTVAVLADRFWWVGFGNVYGAALLVAYVTVIVVGTYLVRRLSHATIGLDGVLLCGPGRGQFYPYSRMVRVHEEGANVFLTLTSDERVRMQVDPFVEDEGFGARLRDAIDRTARARDDATTLVIDAALRVAMANGADAIEALLHGAHGYRSPALSRAHLWNVVEGPGADSSARLLAARALTHGFVEADQARLRGIAARCAEPETREALHTLADQDIVSSAREQSAA